MDTNVLLFILLVLLNATLFSFFQYEISKNSVNKEHYKAGWKTAINIFISIIPAFFFLEMLQEDPTNYEGSPLLKSTVTLMNVLSASFLFLVIFLNLLAILITHVVTLNYYKKKEFDSNVSSSQEANKH
ncbi:hypothetical protein [Oceanobacillus halophilus]|uniref:Uncharacterized protein n=1 Tax=Oceanobacillus halophilus TaxID=930130 RepID=A0A495A2V4_9BACI|nr:hypothetical protein [Oceanobacillus halophilus]RKQ33912.1 hypothetical protein D8M06_08790 [Oceanobacillus halophilus]